MNRAFFALLALTVNVALVRESGAQESTSEIECRLIDVPKCQIHVVDRALITSEREGIIKEITVRVGDDVKAGAPLVHLNDSIAAANFELSKAKASSDVNIRYAKTVLETARAEFEQSENLRKQNALSDTDYRRRKLDYDRGGMSVEQSEFEFRIAGLQAELARTEWEGYHVFAPFPGTIRQVMKTRGESVQDGQPIVELVNTDRVQVEGFGALDELWDVKPGIEVEVWLDAPELERFGVTKERFRGKLIHIDSIVQPVTGKVRVVADVTNRQNILRDGLRANMQLRVLLKPGEQAAAVGGMR